MIPEEMLCAAAKKSCEIYSDCLLAECDAHGTHRFSAEFEKKIEKLKRNTAHPIRFHAARRVAAVFLALLLCGLAWLAMDVEARAAVFGWVRETYETFFVYRFEEEASPEASAANYRLTGLPDGYTEFSRSKTGDTASILYVNETGDLIQFSYAPARGRTDWFVDATDTVRTAALVSGNPADLLLSESPDVASAVLWTTPDGTAFFLSGFLSEEALIELAGQVQAAE